MSAKRYASIYVQKRDVILVLHRQQMLLQRPHKLMQLQHFLLQPQHSILSSHHVHLFKENYNVPFLKESEILLLPLFSVFSDIVRLSCHSVVSLGRLSWLSWEHRWVTLDLSRFWTS